MPEQERVPLAWVEKKPDGTEVVVIAGRADQVQTLKEQLGCSTKEDVDEQPAAEKERTRFISGVPVTSPMIGIFYRKPDPNAPPYVEIGDTVDEAAIVGLIEVNKTFSSVLAPVSGEITHLLAQNAEEVAEGQPVILIKPNIEADEVKIVSLEIDERGRLITHRKIEEKPTEFYVCSNHVAWVAGEQTGADEPLSLSPGDVIKAGQPICCLKMPQPLFSRPVEVIPDHHYTTWSFGKGHPLRRYVDIPEEWGVTPPFSVQEVLWEPGVGVEYGTPLVRVVPKKEE
jgi:biotin carboxyl carrier protein